MKRRRLATGIYEDRSGISVVYHVHGQPRETRFPPGTPLDRLQRWRHRQLAIEREAHPPDARGSLARDIVTVLKRLKGQPGYAAEKAHLKAWVQRFGRTSTRWTITRAEVELAIADWRDQGYAARTIRHRCRVLQSLFWRLDGSEPTPVDDVVLPAKPKPRPVPVSDATIAEVALNLRKQEMKGIGRLRDSKTRARFLVLATHPQRPAELQRAKPEDVDLERRLWVVRGAKGGYNTILPLNEDQVAAWRLFIEARAWGAYDTRSFVRTLQRNGWPKGIRPYNLRHSTGFALSARGVDLGDIQALFGHTSPETTRRFYVPGLIERMTRAGQLLDGRFPVAAFVSRARPTKAARPDAKGLEKVRQTEAADRAHERRGSKGPARKVR